jgi:hypothetical protein
LTFDNALLRQFRRIPFLDSFRLAEYSVIVPVCYSLTLRKGKVAAALLSPFPFIEYAATQQPDIITTTSS